MKKTIWILIGLVAVIAMPFSIQAQAQSPQQTLNQYIADLQNDPDDFALPEKIIRHMRGMKQKPAVPAEAEKFEDRA